MSRKVTRYAGALSFVPPNQMRFKNAFKLPGPEQAPPAPTPAPPPTMPMPDPSSPATIEARRKAQQLAGGAGRASTILTSRASRSDTLAGTYGAEKLGST